MSTHIYWNLALQSLKKNYRISLPFLGGGVIMTAMFYSIASLAYNPGLSQIYAGNLLNEMMSFGEKIMMLFTLVFFFYLNSVLFKNRRQENGLFTILGMEKNHLIRIQFYQILVLLVATLLAGLLLGIGLDKIMYMLILRVSNLPPSLGFYVSSQAVVDTILWVSICYGLILGWTIFATLKSNPLESLHGKQIGEKPIKNRWLLATLGILSLGIGYGIALSVQDPISAFLLFFIAVIFVIIGTYLLFIFGSTVIVQLLQKNKSFYYKPNHFISVSTMRYRLKQNGIALANIAILSTMVLVTLSTTTSLMAGVDAVIQERYPREYIVRVMSLPLNEEQVESIIEAYPNEMGLISEQSGLVTSQEVEEKVIQIAQSIGMDIQNPTVFLRQGIVFTDESGESIQAPVIDLADFNRLTQSQYHLASGEMLILSDYLPAGSVIHSTTTGEEITIRENVARPEILNPLTSDMDPKQIILVDNLSPSTDIHAWVQFDSSDPNKGAELASALGEGLQDLAVFPVRSKEGDKREMISLYSGTLFLGIYLSALFMLAVVLIMYYKQISEGLEDQKRFTIMKNVGLEEKQIHKVINDQVLLLFFMPLGMALIHICFAYPMIEKILAALQMSYTNVFLTVIAICFLIFALIYIVIYKLTARTYFKLTCQPQTRTSS